MSWADYGYQGDPQDIVEAIVDNLAQPPGWWRNAACRGVGPDVFFVGPGQTHEAAATLCNGCRVRQPCLDAAVATPAGEDYGFRGGTTREQRLILRRKRAA